MTAVTHAPDPWQLAAHESKVRDRIVRLIESEMKVIRARYDATHDPSLLSRIAGLNRAAHIARGIDQVAAAPTPEEVREDAIRLIEQIIDQPAVGATPEDAWVNALSRAIVHIRGGAR